MRGGFNYLPLILIWDNMKKIICVIPCYASVPTQFMISLLDLCNSSKLPILAHAAVGYNISYLRNSLMEIALESESDYILTLDADQIYPSNTVDTLVEHIDSGKSLIGGLTLKRSNKRPLVFDFTEATGYEMKQYAIAQGLIKCDAMGMGGIMMKPEVLKTIGFPYFDSRYADDDRQQIADDTSFYKKCKDSGIDVWCDANLKYGHLRTEIIGGAE